MILLAKVVINLGEIKPLTTLGKRLCICGGARCREIGIAADRALQRYFPLVLGTVKIVMTLSGIMCYASYERGAKMTRRNAMTRRSKRTEKLDLRLSRSAKQTLQAAATAARKSVSEFVLDSALNEAEERLADRRVFTLDGKNWEAFVAALDAPPRRHPRLERLFGEPSVFDPKTRA